jgi:2-isopropylmalate synthase
VRKATQRGPSRKVELVYLYDTTLRDGCQAEDISFSTEDKIRIALKLDELGIHYIEGGWPGANPKDLRFFKEVKRHHFKLSKVCAFGSTVRPGCAPSRDTSMRHLVESRADGVALFGKAWDSHVKVALRIPLAENLQLVGASVRYLGSHFRQVFFDAEHFFDGFKANREYALRTVTEAEAAGADWIILCDTNGGTLTHELVQIIEQVKRVVRTPLGIHAHNDSDCAVANSLAAVGTGINHVQGTINGLGERCGNANLCSIIPNLKLKLKRDCISNDRLTKLKEVSRFVYELANIQPSKHQPFVGESAFAHKGGVHVSAITKNPETYEHIRPHKVGNRQRVLISDQAGKSNILHKAKEFGIRLKGKDGAVQGLVDKVKHLEDEGFQFEGAEASFELMMNKDLGKRPKYFELMGFRVINEKRREDEPPISEATIMVKVRGKVEHTASLGNGPVNALDNAIRKALEKFYPQIKDVELIDYKVRVLSSGEGTGARVRVLIETGDKRQKWGTVGVSENIIEASWQALVDSITYKLYKDEKD